MSQQAPKADADKILWQLALLSASFADEEDISQAKHALYEALVEIIEDSDPTLRRAETEKMCQKFAKYFGISDEE